MHAAERNTEFLARHDECLDPNLPRAETTAGQAIEHFLYRSKVNDAPVEFTEELFRRILVKAFNDGGEAHSLVLDRKLLPRLSASRLTGAPDGLLYISDFGEIQVLTPVGYPYHGKALLIGDSIEDCILITNLI